MSRDQNKNIENILFEEGKITEDQLSAIKIEHANTGKDIKQILQERELVTPLELIKAKGKSYGFDFVDPNSETIPNEILDKVPESLAKKNVLIPFKEEKGTLHVAMADPLDLPNVELLERKTNLKVKPYISSENLIGKAIQQQYGRSIGREVTEALEKEQEKDTTKIQENIKDVKKVDEIVQDSSIAQVVSIILEYAAKVGASDIHIEPEEDRTKVRYRIDGVLQEKLSKIPKSSHDSLVARVKILADLKIDEKRKPQDGRFKVQIGEQKIDLRISTLPTVNGEKVVIRLLSDSGQFLKLNDLGLRGTALKRLEKSLLKPHGIILVTGPTGSGKTVTLATSLHKINSVRVNIMTLEDPVEIRIEGVNQVQVNKDAGLTFASGLRSFLRQDPDIIMVGEVRDGETAGLGVQAALTGHLVLATLHTNSAAGAVPRLIDMGVENFLLASTIETVVAQRLVRRICPHCKERYEAPSKVTENIKDTLGSLLSSKLVEINKDVPLPEDKSGVKNMEKTQEEFLEELKEFDFDSVESADSSKEEGANPDKLYLYRGKGCEECGDVGYTGRIGIFEVLDVNDKISNAISGEITTQKLHKLGKENGMVTLDQDGFVKALEGITTLEEVLRVAED